MELRGIDVSSHQGAISWAKVAESGYQFAMLRAMCGRNRDITFAANAMYAAKNGLGVGAYHYSLAISVEAAKREAELLVAMLEPYRHLITWPVAYDIEEESMQLSHLRAVNTQKAIAFCSVIRAAGYKPMLYTNPNWLNNFIDATVVGVPVWLAHVELTPWRSSYKGEYVIHQYSWVGRVPGIKTKVDMDASKINYGEDDLGMIYKTVGDVPYGEMRETIRKLVQADCLRGGADGCINVPHEVARGYVVSRRAGAYEGIGIPRKWDDTKKMLVSE